MPYSGARREKATYGMDTNARLGIERLSPAQRFMLGSLAILAIGMAGIGAWVTSQIEEGVVDRTAATTADELALAQLLKSIRLKRDLALKEAVRCSQYTRCWSARPSPRLSC